MENCKFTTPPHKEAHFNDAFQQSAVTTPSSNPKLKCMYKILNLFSCRWLQCSSRIWRLPVDRHTWSKDRFSCREVYTNVIICWIMFILEMRNSKLVSCEECRNFFLQVDITDIHSSSHIIYWMIGNQILLKKIKINIHGVIKFQKFWIMCIVSFFTFSNLLQKQSNISFWPKLNIDACDIEMVHNEIPSARLN